MYGKEPDCETCQPVKLREEHWEAFRIYQQCRGQLIMGGMGDAVDASIPAVKVVMDLENVEDQRTCLHKVLHMIRLDLKHAREQRELQRNSKK